jgi:C-terminal processing protease CtpA/Prc
MVPGMLPVRALPLLLLLAGCGGGVDAVVDAVTGKRGDGIGSVGAVLGRDNDTRALYVREVPPGRTASLAGLLPGDQIVMIGGVYVRDLGIKEIKKLLRGPVGTTLELTVVRGEDVEHVKVTRGPLHDRDGVQPKEEKLLE